jgi:hypothetical protein
MFVRTNPFQTSLRPGTCYKWEHLKGEPVKYDTVMLLNIRLDWKALPETNILALGLFIKVVFTLWCKLF